MASNAITDGIAHIYGLARFGPIGERTGGQVVLDFWNTIWRSSGQGHSLSAARGRRLTETPCRTASSASSGFTIPLSTISVFANDWIHARSFQLKCLRERPRPPRPAVMPRLGKGSIGAYACTRSSRFLAYASGLSTVMHRGLHPALSARSISARPEPRSMNSHAHHTPIWTTVKAVASSVT
jgi:hypothetical protein